MLRIVFCTLLLAALPLRADLFTFNSADEWSSWTRPPGLLTVSENGQLGLVKFHKNTNLVIDAHLFTHETRTRGDEVAGGLWQVGSNPAAGQLVIDGDLDTYWQPSPDDAQEDWFITIDLGRAALAKEIRLTFPDQEGARPLRQFRVFITTGARISSTEDLFLYRQIYRTTQPNSATSISIPLRFAGRDSAMVIDSSLELSDEERLNYRIVQYIQVISEEKTPDGALAEVEVIGVGDNIALGTLERGGFVEGAGTGSTPNLFDANLNTNNTITDCRAPLTAWDEGGTWFRADLGATFFIDEMFIYSMQPEEGTLGFTVSGTGSGHTVLFSDGTPTSGSKPPVDVPESVDYEEVFTHLSPSADNLLYLRYLFEPRKARYLFFRGVRCDGFGVAKWGEMQLFSPGYPAQVEMQSSFIDLGLVAGDRRPKVIKSLSWDADLPPGTRLQLRSRSGNELSEDYTFYDRKGEAVTEEKWAASPAVLRGPVDTSLVVDADWGEWSNLYQFSGENFQSESPRRFMLLQMILSTDDPQQAPTINSLSIEFEDALVQGARGSISPRQTIPNADTQFTYTLWPDSDDLDSGFDRLRLVLDGALDAASVELNLGGQLLAEAQIVQSGDSLFIDLPQIITADSLQIAFNARVVANATIFALDLGKSDRPGIWQSVEAATRRSNIVLLPDLADNKNLIDDLRIDSQIFTPNGDGINDQLEVSFVAFKVDSAQPTLEIYDLSGHLITRLHSKTRSAQQSFTWSGDRANGQLVDPGIYLLRLDLGADSGDDSALRSIAVAY
jgi:hypothetical protein